MRILVMGAGAIGSVFGGLLADKGHEVVLVGRREHMEAVRRNGLHITGLFGEHRVRNLTAVESVAEAPRAEYDLVLVTVKSYDTVQAVKEIAPVVGARTIVISLQNGLGNVEAIAEAYGPERTLGGRVIFGVTHPEPGHVDVTVYAEEVMLGPISDFGFRISDLNKDVQDGQDRLSGSPIRPFPHSPSPDQPSAISHQPFPWMERVEEIARAFSEAGIPTEATTEIGKYIWAKILYNCSLNPLAAILGTTYGGLLETEETKQLMREIVEEIFAVARARSVVLFWEKPEEYIEVLFGRLIPDTAGHTPSMLQDLRKGRRTEIDAMNGAITGLGADSAIPTPVNRLLTFLIKAREGLAAHNE